MTTLLYKNTIPAQSHSDPAYIAGVQAIRDAIRAGKRIHVSMQWTEAGSVADFTVQLTAIKFINNFARGILPMRPAIDNTARATRTNGLMPGSVDTDGMYDWGIYLFGSDTWGTSTASSTLTSTAGPYEISWWTPD